MPCSPMMENGSSNGSSSSSLSMSNLPPVRVCIANQDTGFRGQEQMVGIEEQFVQLSVAPPPNFSDGFGLLSGPAPPIPSGIVPGNWSTASAAMAANQMAAPGQNGNQGMSGDERSEKVVPLALRKPPLPLQPARCNQFNRRLQPFIICPPLIQLLGTP